MKKLNLHRVFSSMNLFISSNNKLNKSTSGCGLTKNICVTINGGAGASKPERPSLKGTNIRNSLCSIKSTRELTDKNCSSILGGTVPNKPPQAMNAGFPFLVKPIVTDNDSQG
ncbi:hypothetical protein [Pseudoalteromonas sp. S16_S37]|uniref:hypothetical protein n=1 Tax=Pseudoalteromonas sp. S16_S37 TaxID=2720228 RepID=UPI0016805CA7|nr:hypothetical protein [Pseudoalteromonas sp. S16_S37]MBD1581614.1 hypothetical protein [Pseudoalteromonas sp. S16_S37]